jgi:hypothetical protein
MRNLPLACLENCKPTLICLPNPGEAKLDELSLPLEKYANI